MQETKTSGQHTTKRFVAMSHLHNQTHPVSKWRPCGCSCVSSLDKLKWNSQFPHSWLPLVENGKVERVRLTVMQQSSSLFPGGSACWGKACGWRRHSMDWFSVSQKYTLAFSILLSEYSRVLNSLSCRQWRIPCCSHLTYVLSQHGSPYHSLSFLFPQAISWCFFKVLRTTE